MLKSTTFQRNVDEVMKNLKGIQESIDEGMTKIVVMVMRVMRMLKLIMMMILYK